MQTLIEDHEGQTESSAAGRITDRLPAWLASMLLHLIALLALALITFREPPQYRSELSLSDTANMDDDLELAEFKMDDLDDAPLLVAQPEIAAPVTEIPLEQIQATALSPTALPALDDAFLLGDGGSGRSGGGEKGTTSLFGLTAAGVKFVYVFDRSGSMTDEFSFVRRDGVPSQVTPLNLAKAELLRSLDQLNDQCRFQIIFYNSKPDPFGANVRALKADADEQGLYPSTDQMKTRAREFVGDIEGRGGTKHWEALEMAIKMQPNSVFLITDAQAKDDPSWNRMRGLATYCRKYKIKVNVIHFSEDERPRSTLARLSRATQGAHRFLDLKEIARATR